MDFLFKKKLSIEKLSEKIDNLKKETDKIFTKINRKLDIENDSEKIKIVLTGQYSAGKSSIIKMLTHRDDIQIGAGITTENANTYDWNGIEIIDTPGIHTELRKDHDEISYKAISEADILMFVTTNELFDSNIAEHFRKLAIDKDKAGEMILVVNKMDRANGNTSEQQKIIIDDLKKVITPYTPEQLNICFISTEDYFESINLSEEDPELANGYYCSSGYENFIETINNFVSRRGIVGKFTTPIYKIAEQIQLAIGDLEKNREDNDIDIEGLKENLRQQIQIYKSNKNNLEKELKHIFEKAADDIKDLGKTTAIKITEECKTQEDADDIMEKAEKQIEQFGNDAYELSGKLLKESLEKLEAEIDDFENSEFSCNLKFQLSNNFTNYPQPVQNILEQIQNGGSEIGKQIIQNSYKTGVTGGLKLSNFSGSVIHKSVIDIGHFLGYKFKPWQGVKIARGIGFAGAILSGAGIVLGIYFQFQEDKKENDMLNQKRKDRQKIRSLFNTEADRLTNESTSIIEEIIAKYFDAPINGYSTTISDIRKTRENRDENCKKLEEINERCIAFIKEIHKSNIKSLPAPNIS